MALSTIYPNGVNEIDVPATQSIAISNYGGGIASIYYLVENANRPAAYQLQQTLENSGVVLGAFAAEKTVKIEAGNSKVTYDVGASPDTGIGNADTLNGMSSDTTDTADTIAARDSSGDIQANAFESTVTTGTAPLTVASTTVVTNLNADRWDGRESATWLDQQVKTTDNVTFQTLALGSNAQGTTTDIQLDSNSNIATGGDMNLFIDSDNNNSDRSFKMQTDAAFGSGTMLMQIYEDGYVDIPVGPLNVATSIYHAQGAPAAETTDNTLTVTDIAAGIITVNNGAAGTTTLTLPLATSMDSNLPKIAAGFSIDFSVINISTNAAEDCTIATNTGWTLVGSVVIESYDNDRARSTGRFRARKTGTGAWTLYRIA